MPLRVLQRRCILLLCFTLQLAGACQLHAEETALDRYVAKPDPTYSWKVVRTVNTGGLTQYIVDLKSQTWRDATEIDRPVWQHWLTIVKPAKPATKLAFLRINGGANGGEAPQSADAAMLMMAQVTNSVIVDLKMVPNQPVVLHGDGVPRKEDDFIAYTWDQFLKTGDETWPARLPMVKSTVRAMDCVQELLASDEGGNIKVEKFVLAGGSKRGWTTWCTAAVDKRVAAAIPIVIDVVNVPACSRHHIATYGFYAEAIGDYVRHNLTSKSEDPRTKALYAIEDPYSYRDRLTMPKYVVNAAGDQYFPPDSSQFYFDDMPGKKYLRYVPNADHSLRDSDAQQSIIAFYQALLADRPLPEYSWSFEKDGTIRVQSSVKPREVKLWQATNPTARDFRVKAIGKAYQSQPISSDDGVYEARITSPEKGWTAFFVELTYDVDQTFPLKLTTAVRILPDTLPFAELDPAKAKLEGLSSGK